MRIEVSTLHGGRRVCYDTTYPEDAVLSLIGSSPVAPFTAHIEAVLVEGVLYLRISAQGQVYSRCDLCGEACLADADCTLDEELTFDSPYYDADLQVFDLAELERQALVLCAPRSALCRPDCKGLCPVCGANRNHTTCSCRLTSTGDNNPFGVLQDIFSTGGANNGSTKM